MKRKFVAAIVILIAALFFMLLPVVPYTSSGYGVGGGTSNRWNSRVSTSYSLVGCGLLLDTNLTTVVIGNGSWTYSKAIPSPMITCLYHPTEILGGAGGVRY
jgi:hypothetical protein